MVAGVSVNRPASALTMIAESSSARSKRRVASPSRPPPCLPRNAALGLTIVVYALCVASAIFLIDEFDSPSTG